MDQQARNEVPILPKSIEQPAISLEAAKDGTPSRAGTMFAWNKDTGEEVVVPEKRKQTKDETQRILKTRQIGACADCRAAKRKVNGSCCGHEDTGLTVLRTVRTRSQRATIKPPAR
jgi:hypothetical protein